MKNAKPLKYNTTKGFHIFVASIWNLPYKLGITLSFEAT